MKNNVIPNSKNVWVAFIIVIAVAFLCFIPDLSNELLGWDDSGYIVNNYHIRDLSLDTVLWAFSEFYLNYWAPLTWISFALDYAFWGLNPVGYHLTNNIMHVLNAGLFFLISLQLLKKRIAVPRPDLPKPPVITADNVVSCSMLAAIFFAIHPLRVESVAWATERKDVLSLLFGLSAVLAYLKHTGAASMYRELHDRKPFFVFSPYYWLAVVLYCFSLFSKTLMVSLPLVLLILDWFPLSRLRRNLKDVLLEKFPFLLLAGITSVIAMRSQSQVMASFDEIDVTTRVLNSFKSIEAYLRLTVWPFGLSPFYVHPVNIPKITPDYALAIAFFIMISACCFLLVKRLPLFMAVWLIYLVTLFPFLGFTQVGPQSMAGRFTYLSGLPVALLLAVGVSGTFSRISGSRSATVGLASAVAGVLLISGYLTVREIAFWKDDVTLWTRVIDLQPRTGRAYYARGCALALRSKLPDALADMNKALAIATEKKYNALHEIYCARARILYRLGDLDSAITDYTVALQTAGPPERAGIHRERGEVYQRQGKIRLANGDFGLADPFAGGAPVMPEQP